LKQKRKKRMNEKDDVKLINGVLFSTTNILENCIPQRY